MLSLTEISRSHQRIVCMALSAIVVSMMLSMGAYATHVAADIGYAVTITQLQ